MKNLMMTLQLFIVLLIILCQQSGGQPNSNARIFRGRDATKNKFPWYIHITVTFPSVNKDGDSYNGGGVLISMKHILTVAHLFFRNERDVIRTRYVPFEGTAFAGLLDIKNDPYLSTKSNKTIGSQIMKKRFYISDILFYPNNKNPGIMIFLNYIFP